MKPIYLSVLTLILAGVISYTVTKAVTPSALTAPALVVTETKVKKSDESVYDRVMRTGKLRCGYGIFEPQFMIDPNTQKQSGTMYEIMQAVGKELGIEVEFTEEVDWGQIQQSLESGRVDAFCPGMWGTAKRGARIGFSKPIYYSTVEAFVRADDTRFDNNRNAINSPDIVIATNDGDITEEIADAFFPKAKRFAKADLTGEVILFQNVLAQKADITFSAGSIGESFMKNNPNALKQVPLESSILVYKHVVGVKMDEHELRLMLDAALEQLQNNGVTEQILNKYNGGEFFRIPSKPFEMAE